MFRIRNIKNSAPWFFSIGLHILFFIFGFFATWSFNDIVIEEDIVSQASLDIATPKEVVFRVRPKTDNEEKVFKEKDFDLKLFPDPNREFQSLNYIKKEQLKNIELSLKSRDKNNSVAEFVGMREKQINSIIYVIDASASMLVKFPLVIRELVKSLESLNERQKYHVIFFQEDRAIEVLPVGLNYANKSNIQQTIDWIGYGGSSDSLINYKNKNIIPQSASNPIPALAEALRYGPDLLFLLSDNITGSGSYKVNPEKLLDFLDKENPFVENKRKTRIMTIQFFDNDPLRTLETIAREHGGTDGYVFLGAGQFLEGKNK